MEAIELQAYDEWIADHLDELAADYAGKVIVIHHGEVILVRDSEGEAYLAIREKDLATLPLVFRVPREEDLQAILRAGEGCS